MDRKQSTGKWRVSKALRRFNKSHNTTATAHSMRERLEFPQNIDAESVEERFYVVVEVVRNELLSPIIPNHALYRRVLT